jgi:hypothetical protein
VTTFTIEAERDQAQVALQPFHTWTMPDGSIWTEFHRLTDRYLLRFPGLADFEIAMEDLSVTCQPAPGTSKATLQHLYLNQVHPLVLSKRGRLVFHGSAVAAGPGAVAFVGTSGRGKSTLAASFSTTGCPFLTDDGLVLERRTHCHVVLPSHPSLRLWEDSEEALLAPGTPRAPALEYTTKARLLPGKTLPFCSEPRRLAAAFFLDDSQVSKIEITQLTASEALMEWARHSFLLDVEEKPRLATHFRDVSRLAQHAVHYRLKYPRDYALLPDVRRAIIAQLAVKRSGV